MSGYSGLFDGVYGTPHSLLSDTINIGNAQTIIARTLSRRSYGRAVLRQLMRTLNGDAVGDTALSAHARVKATDPTEGPSGGGLVDMEVYTGINRVTTTDDKDDVERMLSTTSQPSTYVTDEAGVGGGGKLGY